MLRYSFCFVLFCSNLYSFVFSEDSGSFHAADSLTCHHGKGTRVTNNISKFTSKFRRCDTAGPLFASATCLWSIFIWLYSLFRISVVSLPSSDSFNIFSQLKVESLILTLDKDYLHLSHGHQPNVVEFSTLARARFTVSGPFPLSCAQARIDYYRLTGIVFGVCSCACTASRPWRETVVEFDERCIGLESLTAPAGSSIIVNIVFASSFILKQSYNKIYLCTLPLLLSTHNVTIWIYQKMYSE